MKFVKVSDIKIYMKSGNVIEADAVSTAVTFTFSDDVCTKVTGWNQIRPKKCVMLQSLALGQIEAIVYGKSYSKLA